MAKASPMVRSFNAGEFSELLAGRTDLDRYPASLRSMFNVIAAPQGPALSRSGTAFVVPTKADDAKSVLLEFIFNDEQAKILELANDRIRFVDEDGIQVYAAVSGTTLNATGEPIRVEAVGLDAVVGDQVVLSGFPVELNLNGEIANVTAKALDTYTLDTEYPVGTALVNGTFAKVYSVPCVYTVAEREAIRTLQTVNVLYMFTGLSKPRKLVRYGDYDWRLSDMEFVDGPYLPINVTTTKLTPSATGNAIPDMTTNTAPSGTCSGSGNRPLVDGTYADPVEFLNRNLTYELVASEFFYAFDDDDETYWASDEEQKGTITYTPATGFVCDGYSIYLARDNQDTSYLVKDYAPSSFEFQGYDGTDWIVLDKQEEYVLYERNKSVFIEVENDVSYDAYQLVIKNTFRNGLIEPRIRRLTMRSAASTTFNLVASSQTGINGDLGFLDTDVGRLIRLKGSDGAWRSCEVTARVAAKTATVKLLGEPLPDTNAIREWRLGHWSDTTGWPSVATFFEDRLWFAATDEYPDMFAASVPGDGNYETFSPTDTFGAVLDDSSIVGRLNSRKLARIRWLEGDNRGLVLGTGSEEYGIASTKSDLLTARNAKARPATKRGSADVEPIQVDNQILYVQRSGRTVREFAFVFEADNYKSPSMSQLASHLGAIPFKEMSYAAEPYSLVWMRREDGSVVCLTYNRDENVVGWHRHDFADGFIESMAVIPQKDQLQDALWIVVRRKVDGVFKRYIERLTRFWDFDLTKADAHFVDSGLRYTGAEADRIYGLQHLEGEEVYGLADGTPIGPLTVSNGYVDLPYKAESVLIGLGYESQGETNRLENGAQDGTSMGKNKRVHSISLMLWDSNGGQVGVWNKETQGPVYEDIEYTNDFSTTDDDYDLHTEIVGPIQPEIGMEKNGVVYFRRRKGDTLPFNVVALMPQMKTEDGG